MNLLKRHAFDFHTREWLALALAVSLSFALCSASIKLVCWLLKRERHTEGSEDETEKEYWHMHGE